MRGQLAFSAVAVLAGALGLGACGGSSAKPAASTVDPGLKFAQCMRAHGVSNFPDPGARGRIRFIGPAPGSKSPVDQSALKACQSILPADKAGPPTMTAAQRQAALRFAECMRANGVPGFPDPAQNIPTGPGPNTQVLVLRGMVFAIGAGLDPGSPAFRQAMTRCGVGPPPGAPPPP